ncbi:hypothetical protein PS862_00284 [Pseudomonas fluorescens]|uniref:Uncharacterized protein n=1 Tax=Pseudomonas fluorescens TaxID=294 RepID=A0A5E6Q8A5_PSEFL|nr:hypothetical protein PS639_00800 [Pseudomonas fluorescens]VVO50448.1 hypothetical protein PS862_00284 [Pseudomonas fluorescens]
MIRAEGSGSRQQVHCEAMSKRQMGKWGQMGADGGRIQR